jgi:hypothetical protein
MLRKESNVDTKGAGGGGGGWCFIGLREPRKQNDPIAC